VRRTLVERLGPLAGGLLATLLRLSARRRGLVLVYHALDERQGDLERDLVPPHGAVLFDAQIGHLRRWFDVVAAERILDATRSRARGSRFPVALTFDDDLPSHVTLALPALRARGTPATFFLCGASLDEPHSFWWERLQRALDAGRVDAPRGVRALAREVEALSPPERDRYADELVERAGADPPGAGLRREQVRELAAGAAVGFHTVRHHPLPALDDDALDDALATGRRELEEAAGAPLAAIAYPHGRTDARVAAAARRAGFDSGFAGGERAVTPDDDPLALPRISPAYASLGHFALQLVRALLQR